MSAQTIIDKANGIIADANGLATGSTWPTAMNCLAGTIPTATAFTSTDSGAIQTLYAKHGASG